MTHRSVILVCHTGLSFGAERCELIFLFIGSLLAQVGGWVLLFFPSWVFSDNIWMRVCLLGRPSLHGKKEFGFYSSLSFRGRETARGSKFLLPFHPTVPNAGKVGPMALVGGKATRVLFPNGQLILSLQLEIGIIILKSYNY